MFKEWIVAFVVLKGASSPNSAFLSPQAVPADSSQIQDVSIAWDVRAVSIEGTVSPYEPYTRVLFHLQGQDWMSEQQALPCVTLHVFHQAQVVHRACHLQVSAACVR